MRFLSSSCARGSWGNPCCVNAILQCLCRVSLLIEYFLSGEEDAAVKATTAEVPEVDLYLFKWKDQTARSLLSLLDIICRHSALKLNVIQNSSKFYFKFEWQGNYKRKLFTDICYPLSNMDLSPYSYTFFCKNSGTACVL
ncbi:inactive ubiquitin carboxyl-terminal hydrolase 50 [Lagopus leucura]|uniref:inactive ubiquitin carboxyl-terminal hydrolase 50 n=1 Tax=Lagopus leucura TaxID=30410 RepID=UPI001C680AF2|nr:inactive ubiquitin carboxyl-terminal hydrolase 50 [Lagopus leucura]